MRITSLAAYNSACSIRISGRCFTRPEGKPMGSLPDYREKGCLVNPAVSVSGISPYKLSGVLMI